MDNKVLIYTFSTCPYCLRAKQMLNDLELDFEEIVITRAELADLQNETGYATVPQIFINGDLIGGASELADLVKSEKIYNLLNN